MSAPKGRTRWSNKTDVGSWPDGGNGDAQSNGSDDGELWAGDQGTGETSWSVDWHATAIPARSIRRIVLYSGARTPGHFIVWKGTWGGSSMSWANAFETNVTGIAPSFRPIALTVDIPNANGIKYEVITIGDLGYVTGSTNRGMREILLYEDRAARQIVDFVSPASAVQSTIPPYTEGMSQGTLNLTFDGISNDVQGYNNTDTQHYESIAYSFASPKYLSGVFININPIHSTVFCWKTWEICDLTGAVLASSQLGTNGDNTTSTSCDTMQFLQFPNGPRMMSGFIMQGKFGQLSPPGDVSHGNRAGEVWGVLATPPGGTIIMVK